MPTFLRDPTDTSGALRRYDNDDDAREAIARLGYTEASQAEIEERVTLKEQEKLEAGEYGDKGGKAFFRAAGAGAFDAAVAPVRLAGVIGAAVTGQENLDPLGDILSGRKFMENVAAVAGELAGNDNAEAAGLHWSEESRKIAKANPWASTTGYLGGQIAGGLGLSGAAAGLGKAAASAATASALGSTAARRAALSLVTEGATEGAVLSVGEVGEQAWIQNQKLTSEQITSAVGWGTLVGGGAGLGIYGGGAIYQGGKRAAGGVSDTYRSIFGGPRTTASADVVEDVAAKALGVEPGPGFGKKAKEALEWLRDKAEGAQAATTGADIDTIKKYGAGRWDKEAIDGRALYINRDAIIEGAKKDTAQHLTDFGNASEPIIDEVRRVPLKQERVAQRLSDNPIEQLAEARTQADALENMLEPLRQPGSRGGKRAGQKAEPIDREAYIQTFEKEARDQIDDEVDDEVRDLLEGMGVDAKRGGKTWQRAEQQVLQGRVEPQLRGMPDAVPDPRVGSMVDEVGHRGTLREIDTFFTRQIDSIRKATEPAEAYVILDRTKAALQKWADNLGRYANSPAGGRPTSPEKIQGARRLAEYLESKQEPMRQSLMNEAVWGPAGSDQRAINGAFTRYIESSKVFSNQFMTVESVGYMGKSATRVAREDRVGTFLDRLGRASNVSAERHLRAHLKATLDLTSAIDDAVGLAEKKPLLDKLRATERTLSATLDSLDRTVKIANQIDELIKADAGGDAGVGRTLIGAFLGGGPGAVAAWGSGVVTQPGRMMRQAIGIQRVLQRQNVDIEKMLDGFFARGVKQETPRPPTPAAPAAARAEARETVDTVGVEAEEVFKDEASGVRPKVDPATVAGVAVAVGGAAAAASDEGDGAAGALAVPLLGKAALRKAARGALGAAKQAAGHVSASGVAVPIALRVFLGDHESKQDAFKARAKEIHETTADYGERVRGIVSEQLGDIPQDFPKLAGAMASTMTRGALFLESKLPRSYRASAPGSQGRSSSPVPDHAIAKFARYWSAVHDPLSVLHDMTLGVMTSEQVEAVKTVYPELWSDLSEKLLDRAAQADARGDRLPMQSRQQIGRFIGAPLEPAFRKSVLSLLDQARSEREQSEQPKRTTPPKLADNVGPESMQIQARAARL